ncbi:MAG: OmpA family protein [Hyphomicrobiaceae bacterium]
MDQSTLTNGPKPGSQTQPAARREPGTDGVARLKELLFDTENRAITDLESRLAIAISRLTTLETSNRATENTRTELAQRVDALFERAGTDERFSTSVAVVLDDALRTAEVENHEQVAHALAPLVVQTIRLELRNSQDELVDILYPITGRMVKSYVASAIQDLVRDLNRRVEQNGLMLRIRSIVSGKSVAELAIAESQHLKVDEIFLIRRGSGALVARWPAGSSYSNSDIHLSGVMSAINDFATHAFQEQGGNLRTFELDEFNVYLRASQTYLIAAKCRGIAPGGINNIFDEEFIGLLERLGEENEVATSKLRVDSNALAPLATGVEDRTELIYAENQAAGLAFSPLKALVFLVAIPLFAALVWWGYVSLERAQATRKAQNVLASMRNLAGYPVILDVGYRGQTIKVTGLAPNSEVTARLRQRLGASLPQAALDIRLRELPVPQSGDSGPQIAKLRAELAAVEHETKRRGVQLALERTAQRLSLARPEFERIAAKQKDRRRQRAIDDIRKKISAVVREVQTFAAVAETASGNLSALQSMRPPIHKLSQRVNETATQLALFAGSPAPRQKSASHSASAPSDVNIAAETLAARAQRLLTTAIAVSHTRPAPVPPQPSTALTPREQLEKFIAENAIFFADDDRLRAPAVAGRKLDRLAGLLKQTSVVLRIAGYTDESGGLARNNPLAQSRADVVVRALVTRGISQRRLVAVGRANGVNLTNTIGPASANRRVEFEIGFVGEAGK